MFSPPSLPVEREGARLEMTENNLNVTDSHALIREATMTETVISPSRP